MAGRRGRHAPRRRSENSRPLDRRFDGGRAAGRAPLDPPREMSDGAPDPPAAPGPQSGQRRVASVRLDKATPFPHADQNGRWSPRLPACPWSSGGPHRQTANLRSETLKGHHPRAHHAALQHPTLPPVPAPIFPVPPTSETGPDGRRVSGKHLAGAEDNEFQPLPACCVGASGLPSPSREKIAHRSSNRGAEISKTLRASYWCKRGLDARAFMRPLPSTESHVRGLTQDGQERGNLVWPTRAPNSWPRSDASSAMGGTG